MCGCAMREVRKMSGVEGDRSEQSERQEGPCEVVEHACCCRPRVKLYLLREAMRMAMENVSKSEEEPVGSMVCERPLHVAV